MPKACESTESLGKKAAASGEELASSEDPVQLKRRITLINGVSIIVGSIIGSGIFVSPTGIFKEVNSVGASLLVWVACGVFSFFGAYSYAELGTMIQRSGADYAYVLDAFGPFLGFLRVWCEIIVMRPCGQTIVALTFAKYVLEPIFTGCQAPIITEKLLAALCITIITFANCCSVRASTIIQDVCTWGKTIALLGIIAAGVAQVCRGRVEAFNDAFADTTLGIGNLVRAFYSGLFAYNGWNYLNCVTGEMKNPQRDLPLAIFISCALVTVVYVLANAAYFTTVPVSIFVSTPAVAILFAQKLFGPLAMVMPVFVSLSTFGGVNGIMLTTSRLFYTAAEEGHMPAVLCMIQRKLLTPLPAVLLVGLLSLVYLVADDIYMLMNYMGFVNWLAIGLSVFIVLYFRITRPLAPRPIRVPIVFPVVYTLLTVLLCTNTFIGAFQESVMGILIILTGIPVYLVGVAWQRKPTSLLKASSSFTRLVQKLFLVQLEDKDAD
ncbi:hypothetical protein BOX15_Mlig013270g6 [Macrostomum lignano]|uniref:Uncharacterized protein n=1 Tax=Macrostomum lignano TaxID=282301 RepID=A0A267F557_9PLAT|nr:hypothetical protein BOX15_Mlig014396g1 [Macrostomum lignano]PAA78330.1 hypothetical protein BOX15_Mlig006752g1 [Macrostomum lignano]PAA93787.1 hypothetical protein BOX15_Mlig013270g6 [Macrostomum lignano]